MLASPPPSRCRRAVLRSSAPVVCKEGAELLANGGFETGDVTGWALLGDTANTGVGTLFPRTGAHYFYLGSENTDGVLSQEVGGLSPSFTLTLSFWLRCDFRGTADDRFSLTLTPPPKDLVVMPTAGPGPNLTADSFGLLLRGPPSPFTYTRYLLHFRPASVSQTVQFSLSFRNESNFFRLDDVSLTCKLPVGQA